MIKYFTLLLMSLFFISSQAKELNIQPKDHVSALKNLLSGYRGEQSNYTECPAHQLTVSPNFSKNVTKVEKNCSLDMATFGDFVTQIYLSTYDLTYLDMPVIEVLSHSEYFDSSVFVRLTLDVPFEKSKKIILNTPTYKKFREKRDDKNDPLYRFYFPKEGTSVELKPHPLNKSRSFLIFITNESID
jgi:hypothetical protein